MLFCVCAEKEIENQTQISVFSLFALFNGKSQT